MRRHHSIWLVVAFVSCVLGVGVPYWLPDYHAINLPDSLMGPGLIMVGLAAFLIYTSGVTHWWKGTMTVAASVPAVVFIRVLLDGIKDPPRTISGLWK